MIRILISGFGRIGRNVLRVFFERNLQTSIPVVAINDLSSPEIIAHILRFKTFSEYGLFMVSAGRGAN